MSKPHHTDQWKRLSKLHRLNNPLCQDPFGVHSLTGSYATAECVHHINPVNNAPEEIYNSENLLSLCRSCHDALHGVKVAIRELIRLGVKSSRVALTIRQKGSFIDNPKGVWGLSTFDPSPSTTLCSQRENASHFQKGGVSSTHNTKLSSPIGNVNFRKVPGEKKGDGSNGD